ncbi:MAG: DUF4358 domain-containing protein [Lachnospiraceae bacterium]|nr:DUF4358 domain-containing protein [Lachnospiraceae bacterium]
MTGSRVRLIGLAAAVILSAAVLFTGCGKDKEAEKTLTVAEEQAAEDRSKEAAGESTGEGAGSGEAQENIQADEESVDITSVAYRLLNEITYEDELSGIDLETARMFISFGDAEIEESVIYESSGATAEEIVALLCVSEEDAGKAEEALKQRVEEQKESFEDYVPEELVKLSEAVVEVRGRAVFLSVSNAPDTAKSIISGK